MHENNAVTSCDAVASYLVRIAMWWQDGKSSECTGAPWSPQSACVHCEALQSTWCCGISPCYILSYASVPLAEPELYSLQYLSVILANYQTHGDLAIYDLLLMN